MGRAEGMLTLRRKNGGTPSSPVSNRKVQISIALFMCVVNVPHICVDSGWVTDWCGKFATLSGFAADGVRMAHRDESFAGHLALVCCIVFPPHPELEVLSAQADTTLLTVLSGYRRGDGLQNL